MANPVTVISIVGDPNVSAQSLADKLVRSPDDAQGVVQRCSAYLAALAGGMADGRVAVSIDGSSATAGTSSGTIAITHANLDEGDTVTIGGVVFTAVDADAGTDEFLVGADATAAGDNLEAAILASAALAAAFEGTITANNAAGTVTVSYSRSDGAVESVSLATSDATAYTLSGVSLGVTASYAADRATATIRMVHAGLSAADTVTIGGVVITAQAAGAGADEFDIGADATADAVALAAAINASSSFNGLVTATSSGENVYLTCQVPGKVGGLITLATSDATAFDLSAARMSVTSASVQEPLVYARGVAL